MPINRHIPTSNTISGMDLFGVLEKWSDFQVAQIVQENAWNAYQLKPLKLHHADNSCS